MAKKKKTRFQPGTLFLVYSNDHNCYFVGELIETVSENDFKLKVRIILTSPPTTPQRTLCWASTNRNDKNWIYAVIEEL